jgi:hypothetical protein
MKRLKQKQRRQDEAEDKKQSLRDLNCLTYACFPVGVFPSIPTLFHQLQLHLISNLNGSGRLDLFEFAGQP